MEILDMEITIEKHIYGGYVLKYYMKPDYPKQKQKQIKRAYNVIWGRKEAIKHFKNYIKEEEESIKEFINQ